MSEDMDCGDEVVEFEEGDDQSEADEFECDFSAYHLFHEGNTGAPCLSFDIVKDDLGDERSCDNPVTCYFVTGSQSNRAHLNNLILLKMKDLKKITPENDEGSDSDSENEESNSQKSSIASVSAKHEGCVNRIRTDWVNNVPLAATWSELGTVHIWDLTTMYEQMNREEIQAESSNVPIFSYSGHQFEGFAVDWSPQIPGALATGDCSKHIRLWSAKEGGTWEISAPYSSHFASVEDIQWSPNEAHVFASCSVDKSIRIWDGRAPPKKGSMLAVENAHSADINVIHWNRNQPFIVSGGDDGKVLVWDLKKFQNGTPAAQLNYHNKPITTVEWHPTDSSVLATGSEDDQILQWDLAVEKDDSDQVVEEDNNVPDQLLFIHKGQKEVKELHWHPQIPGLMISTAHSGFNIFKTISC